METGFQFLLQNLLWIWKVTLFISPKVTSVSPSHVDGVGTVHQVPKVCAPVLHLQCPAVPHNE